MPGLAGVLPLASDKSDPARLDSMLDAMTGYRPVISKLPPDPTGFLLGLKSRETLPLQRAKRFFDDEYVSLIVDGEFHAIDDRLLDEAGQVEVAELLSRTRQSDELATLLARIDGVFAFALFRKQRRQLTIGVDAFGLRTLYYSLDQDGILFAGEVKSVAAAMTNAPALDLDLACEMFCFGYPLTQATLVEGVTRVPPATIVEFDSRSAAPKEFRYWAAESLFGQRRDDSITRKDLTDAFGVAVRSRASQRDKICVPISGGLDSRAIAAAYGEQARGLHSYTLAAEDSLELRAASAIAEIAGVVSHVIDITRDVDMPARQMAELDVLPSDGQKPPLAWFTHLYEDYSQTSGTEVLVVGLGAEVAKLCIVSPAKLTSANEHINDRDEAIGYFSNALCQEDYWGERLRPLLSPDFVERLDRARDNSLRHLFRHMPDNTPMIDMMGFWYLNGYLSQGATFGLMNRRPYYELRCPFADKRLLELLLKADPQWRRDASLQIDSIARYAPAMMKVKNCNTGIPLSAGPVESFATRVAQKIREKVARRGVQLSPQQWRDGLQRNEVRELMVTTLGSEAFLSRGIVDADRFTVALDEYMSGADNGLSSVLPRMLSMEMAGQTFNQAHRSRSRP